MFCKYCGSELTDDAIFCSKCGKKLVSDREQEKTALPQLGDSSVTDDTPSEAIESVRTDEPIPVELETKESIKPQVVSPDEVTKDTEKEAFSVETASAPSKKRIDILLDEQTGNESMTEAKTSPSSTSNVITKILVAALGVTALIVIVISSIRPMESSGSTNSSSHTTNPTQQYDSDIERLINSGKDVNFLLHITAASNAPTKVIQRLINAGANVNVTDSKGQTPLMYPGDTKLLINSGANINAQDKDGLTPLMWAVINNNLTQARILVESGADKGIKDNKGLTAFDIAAIYNYDKLDSSYLDFLK